MRALIHIGMPKTGSTTIQGFLQMNRARLREEGVFYRRYLGRTGQPEFLLAVESAMGNLTRNPRIRGSLRLRTLRQQKVRTELFERRLELDLRTTDCTRFIASSEYLGSYGRPVSFIDALDRWLRARFSEVEYLVYLRRQEDWLVSTYSQRVRAGEMLSLEEFVVVRKLPNLDAFVARWESVVGADRLTVRLLDRSALVGGDLLADFCAAASLDVSRLRQSRSANEGLGARHVRMLQASNRAIAGHVSSETARWALMKLANGAVSLMPRGSERLVLDPASREAIRAASARSNERLRARRFPERETLFS